MAENQRLKIVEISVEDLITFAQKLVLETYGGFGLNEIERVNGLKFRIPDMIEEGKCNEIHSPEQIDELTEEGCGETGGSCICGELKDHEGDHVCKLCGDEW